MAAARKKTPAKAGRKAPKKISRQALIEKIQDIDVSDDDIAKYFIIDTKNSDAFAPKVVPNPSLIEDDGLEGAFFINIFNKLAKSRRNRKYRRRIKNWDGVRIVAEGDSWFQYPLLLKDTIDQLTDTDNFQYAIYGLSEAGDLLSNIINEDEITGALERENPDVFLISGGGNDMVGNGRAANLVHPFSTNRLPENYPNENYDAFLVELDRLYRGLFTRILANRPHLKIICHGYDNAIPQEGPWLGKPLETQNITNKVLQRQIVAEMIRRFNETMKQIATDFPGSVYHVDCQRVVGTLSKWHDELHPKDEGYFKVAQKFDEVIKRALSDNIASPAIDLSAVNGNESATNNDAKIKLAQMQKLDNQDFLNLVVKRAEETMSKAIAIPKTRYERKQLEADISNYYEKIHKEDNFLPSSFLEKGVQRAQSVCRIVTDTSYGSGFLIASRNFIMTNNHVLPDADTAASSSAQFDYDEDDILYTVELDPDTFFITDKKLDFTIVACNPDPLPDEVTAIPLLRDVDTITRGERVNIVQHPAGRKKEISLHDNKVNYVYDVAIRYTADTEGGSSGSPVFNNQWNLVALHHAGWSDAEGAASNEGIRLAAIVEHLVTQNVALNDTESNSALESLVSQICECADLVNGEPENNTKTLTPLSAKTDSQTFKNRADGKSLTLTIEGNIEELNIRMN